MFSMYNNNVTICHLQSCQEGASSLRPIFHAENKKCTTAIPVRNSSFGLDLNETSILNLIKTANKLLFINASLG